MIYVKDRIHVTPTTYADNFYNYISRYDDRLTHESGSTDITFDNKFTLRFPKSQSRFPIQLVYDNSTINIASPGYWPNEVNSDVILIINENLMYFYFDRVGYTNEANGGFVWVIDENNKNLVGGISTISENVGNIERATFYDVDEQSITPYNLGYLFNFQYGNGKILYSDQTPIYFSEGYSARIPNLIPCTTMTAKNVITIDGNNYYTIGTNNLVLLNEE